MITISHTPYSLLFKRPFGISSGTRKGTDIVLVELTSNGFTGYGEASLPPYLEDNTKTVIDFLSSLDLQQFHGPALSSTMLDYVHTKRGNYPAKAAFDMAYHDLKGKCEGRTCAAMFGLDGKQGPVTTYTIGMAGKEQLPVILEEAKSFPFLKIKAGSPGDRDWISRICSLAGKPFCVDANQGWSSKEEALDMIHFLNSKGAVFIEQPMKTTQEKDMAWLKLKSPLPLIADESFQTFDNLDKIKESFHGINIKLMKCGGMRPAYELMQKANAAGLKILLGCMSESSCGVTAAAQLFSLADWADLDGPLLITNDPFKGLRYDKGRILLNDMPGNGVTRK